MIPRLRNVAVYFIIFLPVMYLKAQPNITSAEYYIDSDPGYGKATSISISPGKKLSDVTVDINPIVLSTGVHLFGIRAKDATGSWSIDNKLLFVKNAPTVTLTNVIKAEYYVDIDPGYGNASAINLTSATDLSNFAVNVNPAALTPGVHLFGIRSKDANGAWSLDNKWLFVKDISPVKRPNIVRVEYYIDNDPGYGNASPLNISADTNLVDLAANVNISGLADGAHIFLIRAKDANGAWSLDNKLSFISAQGGAVPITFTNLTGQYTNNTNQLTAIIQLSVNIKTVEVERSIDGTHFTYIGDMAVNPVSGGTYKYDDKDPTADKSFYRLRIVDNDGSVSYSYIILLNHTSKFSVQLFPNPVQDHLTVHFENAAAGIYTVHITDILGKDIFLHKVNIIQDNQTGDVNISFNRFIAGIYFAEVRDALHKIVIVKKIIKQ